MLFLKITIYFNYLYLKIILYFFLSRYSTGRNDTGSGLSGIALLVVTLKLLIEPNQLMLVIINVFVGMQQAFFGADFTAVISMYLNKIIKIFLN